MKTLKRHILGACILGGLMMTTTLAFSAYQPDIDEAGIEKTDMLFPVPEQNVSYEPAFLSSTGNKAARERFNLKASDRQQIAETVIEQLKAFAEKDAKKAYSLAAPAARADFVSANQFLNNLNDIYQLITRSRIERLDGLDMGNADPRQRILLTSPSGRMWMAYFTMQKQPGGEWKVLGFMIEDAPGQVI